MTCIIPDKKFNRVKTKNRRTYNDILWVAIQFKKEIYFDGEGSIYYVRFDNINFTKMSQKLAKGRFSENQLKEDFQTLVDFNFLQEEELYINERFEKCFLINSFRNQGCNVFLNDKDCLDLCLNGDLGIFKMLSFFKTKFFGLANEGKLFVFKDKFVYEDICGKKQPGKKEVLLFEKNLKTLLELEYMQIAYKIDFCITNTDMFKKVLIYTKK